MIAYKIVHIDKTKNRMLSSVAGINCYLIPFQYKLGKTTKRRKGFGPMCCYTDLNYAINRSDYFELVLRCRVSVSKATRGLFWR